MNDRISKKENAPALAASFLALAVGGLVLVDPLLSDEDEEQPAPIAVTRSSERARAAGRRRMEPRWTPSEFR